MQKEAAVDYFKYYSGGLSAGFEENESVKITGIWATQLNTVFPQQKRILTFFAWRNSPPVGQGIFIIEASRSHSVRHTTLSRSPLDE
jgi:hypothetical protein